MTFVSCKATFFSLLLHITLENRRLHPRNRVNTSFYPETVRIWAPHSLHFEDIASVVTVRIRRPAYAVTTLVLETVASPFFFRLHSWHVLLNGCFTRSDDSRLGCRLVFTWRWSPYTRFHGIYKKTGKIRTLSIKKE